MQSQGSGGMPSLEHHPINPTVTVEGGWVHPSKARSRHMAKNAQIPTGRHQTGRSRGRGGSSRSGTLLKRMRICSRCASRAEPFPGPLGAIGTSNHSVSGADETPRSFNENIPVGVLLEPEERYVGFRTAVVEHVANHLRSFDIAVMRQNSVY